MEKKKSKKSKICLDCYNIERRNIKNRPAKDILISSVNKIGLNATGKIYNVSGTTIRKWIKN